MIFPQSSISWCYHATTVQGGRATTVQGGRTIKKIYFFFIFALSSLTSNLCPVCKKKNPQVSLWHYVIFFYQARWCSRSLICDQFARSYSPTDIVCTYNNHHACKTLSLYWINFVDKNKLVIFLLHLCFLRQNVQWYILYTLVVYSSAKTSRNNSLLLMLRSYVNFETDLVSIILFVFIFFFSDSLHSLQRQKYHPHTCNMFQGLKFSSKLFC